MNATEVFDLITQKFEGHFKTDGTYQCSCPCPGHEDKNPSCNIKLSGDKILAHCFVCGEGAAGVALRDQGLWPTSDTNPTPKLRRSNPQQPIGKPNFIPPGIFKAWNNKPLIRGWVYKDQAGKILGYVARYESSSKKEIVPYFKYDSNKWKPVGPKAPKPLYGLFKLFQNPKEIVWVVEGEKCAEALNRVGKLAVTSIGGHAAAGHADWSPLIGRKVRIWPDHDKPGKKYADEVKFQLEGFMPPPTIEIVDTAKLGLKEKEDVYDWLQIHKPEELDRIPLIGKKGGLQKTDVGKLIETEFRPEEFILAPWLPTQGMCMIHSRPGVGKTFLAIGIAFAVAAGTRFLKWESPQPRNVLYIDGEMAGNDIKKRYERIVVEHGFTHPGKRLEIITPDINENMIPDIGTVEGQKIVEKLITNECELVILDNLSCLQRSGDEDKSRGWTCMQEWLLHLKTIGKTILLIHHSGKGGSQRGTSKREDALNTILTLKRNPMYEFEEGACFEVHYEKARGVYGPAARPFEAKLDIVEGVWTIRDLKMVTYEQVVRMMKDGSKQIEVAQILGKTRAAISQHVKKAKEKGDL